MAASKLYDSPWRTLNLFFNHKEFHVFVIIILVYNLLLFFAVIRPVVGPRLSRKKTDPVSRFEIHWILIISTKLFISLKTKMFMCLMYIYFIIRYHQFKDEWKAKKAPGEKSHKNLRWNVRVSVSDYIVFSLFHISLTESFKFCKIRKILQCRYV